ncbi:MAG: FmdE, Molybdenum formylmethanofuran dehydrogenase operon [Methanoregulaceae archaeon PtaB.Bin009]|jgi:formylmethanofuran dehydrogenase subunit E|nr:MAG: FmdE, Molybdenum formylmethanofuran dehydrogenase operon [Methanoregulaceae archaeon PtaB.Bin009]OPY40526.1 MAG: FmdE, Molybdenum formylmethanofuran dehydrogenase operon [Methanoregulaceae archaeon PtaU1.Bin066]
MDAHTHSHCRYYNLNHDFTVTDLAAFHGHLGPYIVLGYRIGKYIREHFCSDPFQMKAEVYCAGTPPQSCLADGVQLGSGCTLGKRNIEIVRSDTIRCVFWTNGKRVTINPRPIPLPQRDMDYEAAIEGIAENMYTRPERDLFDVIQG